MKISKKHMGIFLLAFGVGCFLVFLFKSKIADNTSVSYLEIESSPIKSEIINNSSPNEDDFKPKVFKVENFWKELKNQSNKHLLEIGEVSNGEDFNIKSGEIWLGLYGRNTNTKLISSKIRVKKTYGSDFDRTKFSTNTVDKPLFLVKNLKKLKTGKVETLYLDLSLSDESVRTEQLSSLKKQFVKEFKLGEKIYTLKVEEGVNEKQEKIWVLLMESEDIKQIIYYIYYSGEDASVGNIYWVGDLDSDGKLDIFMDFWNYEKGGYSSGLFISSEAEKGKLVKLFEYFALGGC